MKILVLAASTLMCASALGQMDAPTKILVGGTMNCAIEVGPSLQITGENGAVSEAAIRSATRNGVLDLAALNAGSSISMSIPKLTAVWVRGTSNVAIEGLNSGYFEADVSGTSNVAIEGSADYYHVKTDGTSNVAADGFFIRNLHARVTGTSNFAADGKALHAYLFARGSSNIAVSGFEPRRVTTDRNEGSNINVDSDE